MDSTAGTIVVGIDGSRSSREALSWAAEQARAEHRPLTLVAAVGVASSTWPSDSDALPLEHREALQADARSAVREARAELERRTPELEVHQVIEPGDPRALLLDLSEEAALVVVGSRGRGPVRSLLLGSVGVALTRQARCPVVVHRPMRHGVVRNGIVVGADATPDSRAVLEFAYRQASLRDLPLLVLHCFWDYLASVDSGPADGLDYDQERLMLAESMAGLTEKYPDVRVRTEAAHGAPAQALVRAGDRMDLLVVGGHADRMARRLMFDSVAISVVEHATCPVAVVPVQREVD